MAEYVGIGAYVLYLFDEAATHYVDNYDGTSHIGFKSNGSSFAGLSGASGWVKLNDHSVSGTMKYACTECVDAADIETDLLVLMAWSNHDIYDEDGNLYYNGTNYNGTYNGVDLPEIPADLLAQYPFAVIVEGTELKEEEPDEPEPFNHYVFQVGIAMGLACDGWYKGETATEDETEISPFQKGVEIGRRLKAQRIGQKQPVAYLYNGERFPQIPVVDGLDYAVIEYMNADVLVSGGRAARLILSSEPIWTHDGWQSNLKLLGDVQYFGFSNNDAIWRFTFTMDEPYPPINEWVRIGEEHYDERTAVNNITNGFSPIWANHDVYCEGYDFNWPTASYPIPVYE